MDKRRAVVFAFFAIVLITITGLGGVAIYIGQSDGVLHRRLTRLMVTATRPGDGDDRVMPTSFVAADVNLPNTGHGIDPRTLNNETVKLYRTKDEALVKAVINTSGAGDAIVLQPSDLLDIDTEYTFEVTSGLKDTSGAPFDPHVARFKTASGTRFDQYPVAFEKLRLPELNEVFTGLAIGPDRNLYAGTFDGKIARMPILEDGTLGSAELIQAVQSANRGPRLITGLCFDPRSSSDNLILWISHGQMAITENGEIAGADDWTGKISVLSGANLDSYQDVIVNLPRGYRDHLNNQLAFGPDGAIYFSQASNTAMGAPDAKWNFRPERLLTAAVLRLDPSKVRGTLDVKTEEGGAYDPSSADAPLTIYATGVRVGYDMLWHGNGRLYTAVNGSAAGGNTPHSPEDVVPGLKEVQQTQDDTLLQVERGAYYGHPNPLRGEYVLNGGNPTRDSDPLEVSEYPLGTQPHSNWRRPAYNFGKSVSPNGLIEYAGPAFGSVLKGKILVTRYSGGDDILVLTPGPDGQIIEVISGIYGFNQFIDPLDLVEDRATGNIYVAEFGGRRLTLLRPIEGGTSNRVFKQAIER